MKKFLLLLLLFSAGIALEAYPVYFGVELKDSLIVYDKKGKPALKKFYAFDPVGKPLIYVDYDYVNGRWVENYMKVTKYEDNKEIIVDYFWGVNRWVPSDMLVCEFNENKQMTTMTCYKWFERVRKSERTSDNTWQHKRLVEYTYDDFGECTKYKVFVWRQDHWDFSKTLAAQTRKGKKKSSTRVPVEVGAQNPFPLDK